MLDSRYPTQVCSVARALEVVGERWTLLIIRDAMRGISQFEALQGSLGIARNVLTTRLEHLVNEGVMERQPYGKGGRHAYKLTNKGRELAVVVIALLDWGDRHYSPDVGPPMLIRHRGCRGRVSAVLRCSRSDPVHVPEISVLPGPGLPGDQSG